MSPYEAALPSRASWYAVGLRWIGSRFMSAADTLDRPSLKPSPLEPRPGRLPPEEFLSDVRNRIYSGFGAGGDRPYY